MNELRKPKKKNYGYGGIEIYENEANLLREASSKLKQMPATLEIPTKQKEIASRFFKRYFEKFLNELLAECGAN